MNPKFKKPFKAVMLVCAIVGLLGNVGLAYPRPDVGEDNRLLFDAYGGTPTRFGVIQRLTLNGIDTAPRYYLLHSLARNASDDKSKQLLLAVLYVIRPELEAQIENKTLNFSAIDKLDALVDVNVYRGTSVRWLVKENGRWVEKAMLKDIPYFDEVDFPVLSPTVPSIEFRKNGQNTADVEATSRFYSLIDGQFREMLRLNRSLDSRDECQKSYQEWQEREAVRDERDAEALAEYEATHPESNDESADPDDQFMPENHEDGPVCAFYNLESTLKVLMSQTGGYFDLEVHLKGETESRVLRSKSYLLRYSPKLKQYAYTDDKGQVIPVVGDKYYSWREVLHCDLFSNIIFHLN